MADLNFCSLYGLKNRIFYLTDPAIIHGFCGAKAIDPLTLTWGFLMGSGVI